MEQKKSSTYGLVSLYDKRPLFGNKNEPMVLFAKDVFDRRRDEVLDCARKSGYKMTSKPEAKTIIFEKVYYDRPTENH